MNTPSTHDLSAPQPLLRVRNLCIARRLPRTPLIQDLSLDIASAECFALIGASGSGKTLTALAIAGVLPSAVEITAGHIAMATATVTAIGAARRPLSADAALDTAQRPAHDGTVRVAMVFQDARAALNPVRRIGKQFDDVLRACGVPRRERREQTLDWLTEVAIDNPEDCMRRYPFELSGGMCQRVLIALALARRPALLIADEPTSGLDPFSQTKVLNLLFGLARQHGTSVLLITHDLTLARARCDRIGVLQDGTLRDIAPAQHFAGQAQHPYSRALIDATPALQRMLTMRRGEASVHAAAQLPAMPLTPLLQVRGLCKRFKSNDTPALDDVTFDLPHSSVTGLIGKSGSGKSTLAAVIARLVDQDHGSMLFQNVDIAHVPARRAAAAPWRRDVQLIFQDAKGSLNPLATCRQSIADAWQPDPTMSIEQRNRIDTSRLRYAVDSIAEQVRLPLPLLERLPHHISGGEAARVSIARALINAPKLLILDEATASLDARTQADLLDMLDALRRRLNMTLLVISHDLAMVRMLCDRVLVLDAGAIVEQGDCTAILDAPRHAVTRQLILPDSTLASTKA